ncbi:ABC transporter permease [Candidatus Saccharibacteria bacterium]|nr:ABC transporter permease [Candidatus Saccharibacteria bacterium]
MWSGNFKGAIGSLRANKGRSLLTMLGIIIGISSVVTVVSLGEGLKSQVTGQINQLGSNVITIRSGKLVGNGSGISGINLLAFLSTSTLTDKDVQAISKLPSVNSVVPLDFVGSSASSDKRQLDNIFVVGTSSKMADLLHKKVAYGSFFESDDSTNKVVIGSSIAEELFGELNPVGHSLKVSGATFVVQGVLEPSSGGLLSVAQTDFNSAVFMPLKNARSLTNGRTNILQILAKSNSDQLDIAVNDIFAALQKTHDGQTDFTVLKQYELLGIAGNIVNTITRFISGIAAISLLVGGIGIMDIMLVSVSERTREIGVRKAIGATNRQILNQFLIEGLALTLGGGIIGVIVSLIINGLLRIYTSLQPAVTIQIFVIAVGVSMAVGIIFSVTPALKAARKNPIDALRNE